MPVYSGVAYDDKGQKLKGAQVTLTAPPSTIKVSSITDDEGNWRIEVDNIDNNNVKITFTQEGRVVIVIDKPIPTGVVNEITPQTGGTLNLQGKYPGGKYYVTSLESAVKEDIDKQLENAYKFVKANPGNYRLFIDSSESRVTNYDREPSSPTNGQELAPTNADPSPLARRRAEALQKYANDFFLTKYNSEAPAPTGFVLPEVQIRSVATGLTEYNTQTDAVPYGGDPYAGPKGESYKAEQFTKLIAEFIVAPTTTTFPPDERIECVRNLEIIVEGGTHQCDSAVYQIYLNDILLLREDGANYASLNNFANPRNIGKSYHGLPEEQSRQLQSYDNAINGYQSTKGDEGGNRSNRFVVTDEIARQAIDNNPDELFISFKCWNPTDYYEDGKSFALLPNARETGFWEYNCHKGVGKLYIKNSKGKRRDISNVSTPEIRDEKVEVVGLSPCTLFVLSSAIDLQNKRDQRIKQENADIIKSLEGDEEKIYGDIKGLRFLRDRGDISDEEFKKQARALYPTDRVRKLFPGL